MNKLFAVSAVVALGTTLLCSAVHVTKKSNHMSQRGKTHFYYIAADQVTWNYVPDGIDRITGKPFEAVGYFQAGADPFAKPLVRPVGTSYVKTLYREYTDGTFQTLTPRPAQWEHLGFLGPLIRAEVGDTVRILFRNSGSHSYSIHAHGVFYNKDSEGAPYEDGTSGTDKADDAVPPGGTHEYVWQVPERAGPAAGDDNSVLWMYHSHVDEERDTNAGLMGPILITARGKAKPDGTPMGVDREFIIDFAQIHEEDSWHADQNLPTLEKDHAIPSPFTTSSATATYPYFVTFSINGFSHGSMPLRALTMRRGQHVRWYMFTGVNDFDAHTPHWHGNTVVVNRMRTDVITLAQMQMVVADMVPDNIGTWLFHCHIGFHNEAGMNVRYAVTP